MFIHTPSLIIDLFCIFFSIILLFIYNYPHSCVHAVLFVQFFLLSVCSRSLNAAVGSFCFTCLSVPRCHCLCYCLFRSCKLSYLSSFCITLILLTVSLRCSDESLWTSTSLSWAFAPYARPSKNSMVERPIAVFVPHKAEGKNRDVSFSLMQVYTNT